MLLCLFLHYLLFVLQNIGVGCVYINLGDEDVIHAINETKTSVVITSQNLLARVQKLLPEVRSGRYFSTLQRYVLDNSFIIRNQTNSMYLFLPFQLPNVRHIVYFEDQLMSPPDHITNEWNSNSLGNVKFHSFKSLLNKVGVSMAQFLFTLPQYYLLFNHNLSLQPSFNSQGSQIIDHSLANKQNEPIEQNDLTVEAKPEDTAIVMYTSGSTGTPKVDYTKIAIRQMMIRSYIALLFQNIILISMLQISGSCLNSQKSHFYFKSSNVFICTK